MAVVYSTEQDNSVKTGQVLGKCGKWEFIGFVVEKNNLILRMVLTLKIKLCTTNHIKLNYCHNCLTLATKYIDFKIT